LEESVRLPWSVLKLLAFALAPTALFGQGLAFVAVAPCRIVDTRNPNGPFGGPYVAAGTSRSFAIPNSACGIPSSAQAYSLNVTVVPHTVLGYLTVWPTGEAQPFVSLLNSLDGRIKANAAIVPAGTSGAVSVYATNDTDVLLDIDGYFVSGGSLEYYPLAPCRIADTRNATGPLGGPSLVGLAAGRAFPVLSSSCNVPSSAQAYLLNFTVIPPGVVAYITTWPTGESQPWVSTLNDLITGTVVANAAIVPAGTGGSIDVYASNDTDLTHRQHHGHFPHLQHAARYRRGAHLPPGRRGCAHGRPDPADRGDRLRRCAALPRRGRPPVSQHRDRGDLAGHDEPPQHGHGEQPVLLPRGRLPNTTGGG
jgi:hypothetical protein